MLINFWPLIFIGLAFCFYIVLKSIYEKGIHTSKRIIMLRIFTFLYAFSIMCIPLIALYLNTSHDEAFVMLIGIIVYGIAFLWALVVLLLNLLLRGSNYQGFLKWLIIGSKDKFE